MCELCGCGSARSAERPPRNVSQKGKPISVRVVAIATPLKTTGSASNDATRTKAATIRRGEIQPIASGGV
jgi:hypothetical protein